MKSTISCIVMAALILGLAMVSAPAMAQQQKKDKAAAKPAAAAPEAAPAAAPAPSSAPAAPGQFKIGVVKMREVLRGYKKVEAEYGKLQGDVEARQKKLDSQLEAVKSAMGDYDKEKATMTPDARAEKEASIQKKKSEYQVQLQSNQSEIDAAETTLMKKVMADVDQVVQAMGERESYHLIVDGSSRASAMYFSPTIDITQRVVDELNKLQ